MARKAKKARAPAAIVQALTGTDDTVEQEVSDLDPMTSDQTLGRLIRQFEQAANASRDARRAAEIYRDYYDGKQWSDEEIAKLNARGQPAITDNRIKDKVEYLLGQERELRTDPKAYPRTPEDDPGAEAATDALRYIADCNYFQQTKSSVFENMCVEGYGGCEVIVENTTYSGTANKIVKQNYVRWDRLFYDSHSLLPDFSDSRYQGIIKWMDLDEARAVYKDKLGDKFDLFTSATFLQGEQTYDDKPRWFDRGRKRVQIVEHYYRDGDTWMRAVYTRVGFIEEPKESAYLNCETGKPECPLLLQSLYVDREGNRYGVVKRYKDLQDEINKRRSKSLHLLSVNQATAEKGAVDDVEKARNELARPDGFLEYTPGMKLDVRENTDLAEGQFKLLQQSIASMADTGPNEALLGRDGNSNSGRETQLNQQGGSIQLGILSDRLRYWQTRVMKASWSRVKQFWTGEMWVRVTDDENSRFMALNSKYPDNHVHVQKGIAQPGEPMNVLSDMDVDIIIDEAPDTVTLQQEQFGVMAELAKNGLPIPPQALIEMSSLNSSTKRKVMDAMSGKLPDGTEIPPQVQQMLQQKEQQIQQISEAQQQKAQEQVQTEQQIAQAKADALLQQTKVQAAIDKLKAQQDTLESQFAARQQELTAQMEMLNAKEIELKSLQLIAAANLKATQDAANAVVDGASKEAAINTLTTKLETQQAEHKKQISDLAVQHNQQLHQEREKARAAQAQANEATAKTDKPEKPSKPRKVTIERDSTGRISGATIN